MNQDTKQGLVLLGFLVAGIVLLASGLAIKNLVLIVLGIASFIGMMGILYFSLRKEEQGKGQEILYRRGSQTPRE